MKLAKLNSLVPIVSNSYTLKSLNLSSNNFGKDFLDPICASIMVSPTLKYLDLSFNSIGNFALKILNETFK